jgi:predicted O-methyltransferase YrrM
MPFRAPTESLAGLYARSQGVVLVRPTSTNSYALQPDTLRFLGALLEQRRPRHIVEFGCGESTYVLAPWAAHNAARLVSVENDRQWLDRVRADLHEYGHAVDWTHARLRIQRQGLRSFYGYHFGAVPIDARLQRADMVIIDGPHATGRELVLRRVLAHTPVGCLVVIDDWALYPIRDMLGDTPERTSRDWEGEAIEANSHGLYVLRRVAQTTSIETRPTLTAADIARSYWRTLREAYAYRQAAG